VNTTQSATPEVPDVVIFQRHVIGLDLSLTGTGVAVSRGDHNDVSLATISTRADNGSIAGFSTRCAAIANMIDDHARSAGANPMSLAYAVEGLSLHSKSSSLDRIFASWWMILAELRQLGWPEPSIISPNERAMYATGKGNANKEAVLLASVRRYPLVDISDNNQADATVIMAMLRRHLGAPIEAPLPQTHLRALEKVRWAA